MVRFVVSMTTLPKRLPYIKPVVRSILENNPDIDKLYICLPYGHCDEKYIPKNSKRLKVIRCRDYGPITKILGVLPYETDPNTLILTLDDDVIVTKNIVKIFKKKAKKYPNAALSMSGWCYGSFPFKYQLVLDNAKDVCVDWIQGVHGILYKRSFLEKIEVLKFERHHPLLFKNDDHRISAYLEWKNIPRMSINHNPTEYYKNYSPASCIDAISGGTFKKSTEFWFNVDTVCKYLKERGFYYRNYDNTYSIVFTVIIFISLAILLLITGCMIGYYTNHFNALYMLSLVIVVAFIIYLTISVYKENKFLKSENK